MATRKTKRVAKKEEVTWDEPVESVESVVEPKKEKSFAEKMMPLMLGLIGVLVISQAIMWNKVQNAGAPAGASSKYKNFEAAMTDLAKKAKVKDVKKAIGCMNDGQKASIVNADTAEGTALGVNGTPAFYINGRLIPGAVPFEEFKKVIDQELGTVAMDASVERKTVAIGNAATKGQAGASITMIEYSDFQCPFCGRAHPTVQQVLKEYDGKVVFAYKHFPLSIHPRAQKTGELAECARDQGKFWEMHDALFEFQNDWAQL